MREGGIDKQKQKPEQTFAQGIGQTANKIGRKTYYIPQIAANRINALKIEMSVRFNDFPKRLGSNTLPTYA